MSDSTLTDELNISYALFDLNKDSAVKSPQPPEDRPLSVSTAGVRKVLLRVDINEAAGPDNKVYYTENVCRSASLLLLQTFLTPSPQESVPLLPGDSHHLPCTYISAVLMTTTRWLSPPS